MDPLNRADSTRMRKVKSHRGAVALTESTLLGALIGVGMVVGFGMFVATANTMARKDGCLANDIKNNPGSGDYCAGADAPVPDSPDVPGEGEDPGLKDPGGDEGEGLDGPVGK